MSLTPPSLACAPNISLRPAIAARYCEVRSHSLALAAPLSAEDQGVQSMADGGGWEHPLYWLAPDDPRSPAGHWQVFGLRGLRPLDDAAPVSQLSFYEAAAYAEWAGARLPTEFEWEAAFDAPGIAQMTGQVWQWTRSSYDPYPGFRPRPGAVGEYNGKFMVSQVVLRGSSGVTPPGHSRPTYRNFFPPAARWQFSGLRLAKDGGC